jgi:hypothetical protein
MVVRTIAVIPLAHLKLGQEVSLSSYYNEIIVEDQTWELRNDKKLTWTPINKL